MKTMKRARGACAVVALGAALGVCAGAGGAAAKIMVAEEKTAAPATAAPKKGKAPKLTNVYVIEWVRGDRPAMKASIEAVRAARVEALKCLAPLPVEAGLLHVQVRKGAFAVVDEADPDLVSCLATALSKAGEPGVDLRLVIGRVAALPGIVAGKIEASGVRAGTVAAAWKKWLPELRACVAAIQARNPAAAGVGELLIRVGDDGMVTDATTVGALALSGEAGGRDCISVLPLGWKLPAVPVKDRAARTVIVPVTIGGPDVEKGKAAAAARKLDHAAVVTELAGMPLVRIDGDRSPSLAMFALDPSDTEKVQKTLSEYYDCHEADGTGWVELLVHVAPDGDLDDARMVRLAGPPGLEECALALVYKTRIGAGGRTGWASVKLEKK